MDNFSPTPSFFHRDSRRTPLLSELDCSGALIYHFLRPCAFRQPLQRLQNPTSRHRLFEGLSGLSAPFSTHAQLKTEVKESSLVNPRRPSDIVVEYKCLGQDVYSGTCRKGAHTGSWSGCHIRTHLGHLPTSFRGSSRGSYNSRDLPLSPMRA